MAKARKPKAVETFVPVEGRTLNQRMLIEDIYENDYTFAIGPAGTGKTHIAAGIGAELLLKHKFDKIILTRPIVACEDIGYLPGDHEKKIHPYLMPLFDELGEFINVENYMKQKKVVIEPLAFMRGRTLKNSFIILDEAQNATYAQLKMALTRFGEGSKMVITGDLSQTDLFGVRRDGLFLCLERLKDLDRGVAAIRYLDKSDIVRHPSVRIILDALESGENNG